MPVPGPRRTDSLHLTKRSLRSRFARTYSLLSPLSSFPQLFDDVRIPHPNPPHRARTRRAQHPRPSPLRDRTDEPRLEGQLLCDRRYVPLFPDPFRWSRCGRRRAVVDRGGASELVDGDYRRAEVSGSGRAWDVSRADPLKGSYDYFGLVSFFLFPDALNPTRWCSTRRDGGDHGACERAISLDYR